MSELNDIYPRRADLPAEWQDVFDAMVGEGKSPAVVLATIEYVRDAAVTQQQAADEFDVSDVSLRNNLDAILNTGPRDQVAGTSTTEEGVRTQADERGMAIKDYKNRIATRLGWIEGEEYNTTNYPGNAKRPILLKPGWESARRAVTGEGTVAGTIETHCDVIAAQFDWSYGIEYFKRRDGNKLMVRLNHAGWRSLHDAIIDNTAASSHDAGTEEAGAETTNHPDTIHTSMLLSEPDRESLDEFGPSRTQAVRDLIAAERERRAESQERTADGPIDCPQCGRESVAIVISAGGTNIEHAASGVDVCYAPERVRVFVHLDD